MTKRLGRKSIFKGLTMLLILVISVTCLSITTFAESFYQGGDVITGATFSGDVFSTGNNNRLTISARADTKAGTPTGVYVVVQKYGFFGWTTITSATVPMDDPKTINVCRDLVVPTNTSIRILCTVNGSGANVATIHMGVGTWQAVS